MQMLHSGNGASADEQFRKLQLSRKRWRRIGVVVAALLTFVFVAKAPDINEPRATISAGQGNPLDGLDDSTGRALETLQWFAANALVLPLIDDTDPPRWSDHMIDWICDGRGRVTIDGRPLPDGEPVGTSPFSVRWDLERCAPFGGSEFLIEGVVELTVSLDGADFTVQIITPVKLGVHRLSTVAAKTTAL